MSRKAFPGVLFALGLVLLVAVIVPLFIPVKTSGPPAPKDAVWVEGVIRDIIREAQGAGTRPPGTAAELKALVSASTSGFLLRRSLVDCQDVSPGVVLIVINTPPGEANTLRYEYHGGAEYRIIVLPPPNEDGGP